MFMPELIGIDEEFGRPVETIMRCEDFKSNFARKLSNRYISRSPINVRQDTSLKLFPDQDNAPERIEASTQLSKSVVEQNDEAVKPPEKKVPETDNMRNTEVNALNMEVETLRWQLSQTEANRQMHIALLKQIVSFLSRVKEHIECQKSDADARKETVTARLIPRSFNIADLPRSRSVVHVNKNSEFSLSPVKKISTKKISKSISNVNGCKENIWSPSKIPLIPESDTTRQLTEEIARLITLATTVLSTQIPDLACTCNDINDNISLKKPNTQDENPKRDSTSSLNSTEGVNGNAFILNTIYDSEDSFPSITNKLVDSKDKSVQDFILSSSPLTCGLENDFADVKIVEKENLMKTELSAKAQILVEKRNEYNVANFIEDESGFSSMNSFQEIGIPIISIIPPSPCKEVGYMDDISDILSESSNKWKNDSMELDKQAVKVFWV